MEFWIKLHAPEIHPLVPNKLVPSGLVPSRVIPSRLVPRKEYYIFDKSKKSAHDRV